MSGISRLARNLVRAGSGLSILTGAKGFTGDTLIASPALNRRGLHRWRVENAARMVRSRRARLAELVDADLREDFGRDGFVIVPDALAPDTFEAMKRRLLSRPWPAREMVQGDTLTRRCAVNPDMLRDVPELRNFLDGKLLRGLTRYVAASDIEPLYYMQTVLKRPQGEPDPQTNLHADTFHSSMKAWLFLDDVEEGEGAFTYVPGSHRATEARLDWEQERAIELLAGGDRMSRRGSFRLEEGDRERLGLPTARAIACKANTLVVADTFGFHARGPSSPNLNRIELWAYSRRNPFLPWLGGDPLSITPLARRQMDWLWRIRDARPQWFKQPWKSVGERYLDAGHDGTRA